MRTRGKLPLHVIVAAALLGGAVAGIAVARGGERPSPAEDAERAVRAVLAEQVAAWNRGDIDAFMEGYDRSDGTRFASGGSIVRGWQTVRDRYKARYDTREKMGHLTFDDLELTQLSPTSVVAFGRWKLDLASGRTEGGLFTLLFAKRPEGWRIVADHTSSE